MAPATRPAMRRLGEDDEAKAIDFLAREVLEDVELIDTGCVDTDGNKIVIVQRMTGPVGFVDFALK